MESSYTSFFRPAIFLLFYPCAYIAAILGGTGPAMFNIALSAAGAYWIFHGVGIQAQQPIAEILTRLSFYVGFAGFGSWLIGRGREAEAALLESEVSMRLFRALVDNSSDFIGIADPEGTPVYVNPAGCRMVGLEPSQPVERTRISDYYAPDQRAFASEVILKTMLEQGRWAGETSFRHWRTQAAIPVSDEHFMIREPESGRLLGMGTIVRDVSERKRLEEALRQREADLNRAQQVAGIGSWRMDIARNELAWSEETYRLFGVPMGSRLNYPDFLAIVHPDDRASVEAAWSAALGGEGYDIEHRIRVNGEVRWVHERAEVERDARGRALRGIGTVQDITERKRVDEELRRLGERERFRLALDAASNAMVVINRDGRIAFVNGEAVRLFGWRREELIGQLMEVLVPARFRAAHPAHREAFFHEKTGKRPMGAGRDLFAKRRDGSEFPVEIGLTRVEEGGGDFVVASVTDITPRKRAESALRESEERFRLLVEGTRDYAIFMHDPEGRITVWNQGAERVLGLTAAEVLGKDYRRFFTPEDLASGEPGREMRVAVEKGSNEIEGWRLRKDGSRFWAAVLITPIRDASGRLLGFGKVIRDLTERRSAEQELMESEAKLRKSVVELEAFAYTISHDLRSPIRAVEGYSHFLAARLAGRLDAESREMLERIRHAAVRLDRLIRDLLSYAAIGRETVELAAVEIDPVVVYVTQHYPELAKAHIKVRSPLGRVRAQESLLIQILSNLLANAAKFAAKDRSLEIEIWTERREEGKFLLVVQDNGIGIPPEAAQRVFQPFVRLNRPGEYEGTGIGLAIVQRAAERMGGRVYFESEPGQGSRFYVELQGA